MKILDTTIRDGSYSVEFNITIDNVISVCQYAEKLGIEYIEIGHGQGLNASSYEHGVCPHSDLEYMIAANSVLKKSKYGFFCIPNIARLEDIRMLKENNGSFVRIGVNVDELDLAKDYVECAKYNNLITMVNLMKTYIAGPEKVAQAVKKAKEFGTDCVYLVDSAGCMLPTQLVGYIDAIRKITDIKLGFHGHNNLGMAVANSIVCAQKGFDFIDTTFQGIGRSIGNTSTEQFVMTAIKSGIQIDIDIPCLLEYGYCILRDFSKGNLVNPLDYVCGYSGFHSGNLKKIYECCHKYLVDPLRLIIEYSKYNKKNIDVELLERIATELPRDDERHPYNFLNYFNIKDI